ncbi:MAG: histidine triad nucleotide-binding protein [Candidatus Marinimicrobia bacterium]|nr:histidine triad nucleotide-binding protein [Candidatus Neomarinimicrobiota bacterium]
MSDCLFCKILDREIPADIVFENEYVLAFNDINPQAPVHILIIPKEHIATSNDIDAGNMDLVGEMLVAAKEIAAKKGIGINGYRTVINCNEDGGQAVYHIHMHLLGGRQMSWPPG